MRSSMVKSLKNSLETNAIHQKMNGNKPLSEKEEEIIEYIGKFYDKNPESSIKRLDLAEILQCSPALVNKLLKKLEERKLILHKKYGEIKLTENGLKASKKLIRKHRLSEALFVDLLGLSASEAHDFACKFEHILDDKLADRIENVLNNPSQCPHGHPVPFAKTKKAITKSAPLNSFANNEIVQISQIMNETSNFLKKLSQAGIEVGTEIKIIEKSSIDGTFLLKINGKNVSLGEETAKNLMVVSIKDREV